MLTAEQRKEVMSEMVRVGVPVRFLRNGQNINISTMATLPRGVNVIHQVVYWHFPKSTSLKIAKWLSVKPVFSDKEGK